MIEVKSPQDIEAMRQGGKILARVMKELLTRVHPGVTAKELERAAEALILQLGAAIAFRGYDNFPGAICTSVNNEIVHVVPSERILKEGDILSLDIGLKWQGFYLDMARSAPVGKADLEVLRLIRVTKKALRIGIKKARPGNTAGDIGNTIQRYAEAQGYQVVRELCGHGIGRELHEDPKIPNFGKRKSGPELVEGMVICIEPMITVGHWKLKKIADGHGLATEDGSLSCHFEDAIAITSSGSEVLTQ